MCFLTLKKPAVACGQIASSQSLRHSTTVIPASSKAGLASSIQSRKGPVGINGVAIWVAPAREAQRARSAGTPARSSVVSRLLRKAASFNASRSNSSTKGETAKGERRWLAVSVAQPARFKRDRSKSSGRQSSSVTNKTVGRRGSRLSGIRGGDTLGRPSGSSPPDLQRLLRDQRSPG